MTSFTFGSQTPKFRGSFDFTTKVLTVSDLIQSYSQYTGYSDLKAIFQIKDPDNIIFYHNAGYGTQSFSAPDFKASTSAWSLTADLPLDANGKIKLGIYKVSAYYTIGGQAFLVEHNFDLKYVSPVVEIAITSDCDASTLTETDITNYDILVGGASVSPSVFSRTRSITKPIGAGCDTHASVTDTGSIPQTTIGGGGTAQTDLWTGVWQVNIVTDVQYDFEDWSSYTCFQIIDEVSGSNFADVECSNLQCLLRQCWENLIRRWQDAVENGTRNIGDLDYDIKLGVALWTKFYNEVKCGVDTSGVCQELKDLLANEDCSCSYSNNGTSQRIFANSGSGGGGGQIIYISPFNFGNGSAVPTGGNPGDYYWQVLTDHKYVWYNLSGTWINLFDVQGTKGDKGDPGTSNGSSNVLFNSEGTGTSAGTTNEILSAYNLIAGILNSNGDFLDITAIITFAKNDNGKTVKLNWGGDILASYFTESHSVKNVKLNGVVNKRGANAQDCEGSFVTSMGKCYVNQFATTRDLTTTQIISVTGQNAVASALDIICDTLRIVLYSKITGSIIAVGTYESGKTNLVANTPQTITFTVPFGDDTWVGGWTAIDAYGTTQTVTITNITETGFTAETIVDTTLFWSALKS